MARYKKADQKGKHGGKKANPRVNRSAAANSDPQWAIYGASQPAASATSALTVAAAATAANATPLGNGGQPHFSMRDEARNTTAHADDVFRPARKLRMEPPIAFVSGGFLEGTVKKGKKNPPLPIDDSSSTDTSPTSAMARMAIRSPSPAPSDSSVEEIVFKGRNFKPSPQSAPIPAKAAASKPEPSKPTHKVTPTDVESEAAATGVSVRHLSVQGTVITEARVSPEPTLPGPIEGDPDSDTDEVRQELFEKRLGGQSKWMSGTTPWVSRSKPGIGWLPHYERPPMEDFLSGRANPAEDDYFENVKESMRREQEEGEEEAAIPASFAGRDIDDLGIGDNNMVIAEPDEHESGDEWSSDMLHDFDNNSTSSDVIDIISRVLASRTRKSGLQYLVVYEGSTTDDARWLPVSFLHTKADKQLIENFETKKYLREANQASGDDEEDFEDVSDDDDADEDGSGMDDEMIARTLQKQEELGFGSDEILLHGGNGYFAGPADPLDSGAARADRRWKKRQQRSRGNQRHQNSFPNASLLADILDQLDPYDGFDIMDTERPSLKPKKKGRRGQPPPELDDPDLNEQMQATWEADRATKRVKKAEREELRKLGLLGRKGKAADLSVKYSNGFSMDQIAAEIREFILSKSETLSLPPMTASRRAVVHQLCGKLGFNSKSRGSGNDRFTVLSKALRTTLDVEAFDRLVTQPKFRTRFGRAQPRGAAGGGGGGGGGGGRGGGFMDSVRPKAGEAVGASAPELGPENPGHAMLAKMGWSKGTALGALHNKGIINPIFGIAKMDKKGLSSTT
ncbi:hypothetical protein P154DRAFT_522081 [Amniculicola lignicola CBS 123094]|uniref:Protein SQS1 n=1 Tax=Amniculicola lignicola CBS 123094 TaxID=1392246 RepID=A0A6A5WLR3_9PLEO|nr:hypothetical protein P154DRAFT_522081 [Amniculicola lignicola CBS 123094]